MALPHFFRVRWFAVLLFTLSACMADVGPPSGDDEPVAAVAQGLACTASDLVWTSSRPSLGDVCAGPWRYQLPCGCRETVCKEQKEFVVLDRVVAEQRRNPLRSERVCEPQECDEDGHCWKPRCSNQVVDPEGQCEGMRASLAQQLVKDAGELAEHVSVSGRVGGSSCVLDIRRPEFHKDRRCIRQEEQACATKPPECLDERLMERFTAPGLTYGQVVAATGDARAVCTTGEGLEPPTPGDRGSVAAALADELLALWARLHVGDGGFEAQTSGTASAPWRLEGGAGGIAYQSGQAASGASQGWVHADQNPWDPTAPGNPVAALVQRVPVSPNTTYTLSARVRTSSVTLWWDRSSSATNYLGARDQMTGAQLGRSWTGVVGGNQGAPYDTRSLTFTTGPDQAAVDLLFSSEYDYWVGASWMHIDDVRLEPADGRGQDALRRTVIARLRRLYDVWGSRLDADRLRRVREVAFGVVGAGTLDAGCGDVAAVPEIPAECGDTWLIDIYSEAQQRLEGCLRLLQTNVDPALTSKELWTCLDAGASLNLPVSWGEIDGDAACGGPELRRAFRDVTLQMFLKQSELAATPARDGGLGELPRQLALFDAWYQAATTSLGVDGEQAPVARLSTDVSLALRALWDGAYRQKDPFGAVRAAAAQAAPDRGDVLAKLAELTGNAFAIDQAMVEAAFTPIGVLQPDGRPLHRTPLAGAPLLGLVGEALWPLVERADALGVFHDFACTVREGCGSALVDTPLARSWQALGALGDKPRLDAALATSHLLAGWRSTLQKVAAQHAVLATALAGAGWVEGGSEARLPTEARRLARVIEQGRLRHNSFATSGQFEPQPHRQLASGVGPAQRELVINEVSSGLAAQRAALSAYAAGVVALVSSLGAEVEQGASAARLQAEKLRLAERWDVLEADRNGLRAANDDADARFGDLFAEFRRLAPNIPGGALVPDGDQLRFDFDGASALGGPIPLPSTRAETVASGSIKRLRRGQVVSVQAQGQYQASCSLSLAQFFTPNTGVARAAVAAGGAIRTALAGPEGYRMSWNGSDYVATSHASTSSATASVGASLELCQGTPGVLKCLGGFDLKACVYAKADLTTGATSTSSSGGQGASEAAFAAGLRLPNTPFPALPAGALIFVMSDAVTGQTRDAYVVGTGQNAFVVPEDGLDGYFVVNDAAFCPDDDRSQRVHVEAQVLVDSRTAAAGALGAMADVLARLRALGDEAIDQGRLMPSQMAQARSEAQLLLSQRTDATRLPEAARRLFDAFVDHELLRLERRVEILQLKREQRLLELEVAAIDEAERFGAQRTSLQTHISRWSLRHADGRELRARTVDLLRLVRLYFLPVLELWYPKVRDTFTTSPELTRLLGVGQSTGSRDPLTLSVPEYANLAEQALGSLFSTYRMALPGQKPPGEQLPVVVVSVPNPDYAFSRGFTRSSYARVEPWQERALWDAIRERRVGQLKLGVEDLYAGADGYLPCTEHNPVVQRMALYVVRPGEPDYPQLNNLPRRFEAFGGAEQLFVGTQGPISYTVNDGTWQNLVLPIVYGEHEDAVPNTLGDQDFAAQRPIGLSPLMPLEIDFSRVDDIERAGGLSGFDELASEVLIVMQLDSRAAGTDLDWVRACR